MERGRPVKFNDKQKWCPDCEAWLDHNLFGTRVGSASGLDDYCKTCKAKRNLPYKLTWQRKQYGLSDEQFAAMWEQQRGLCAICENPLIPQGTGRSGKTCIDHNHETNIVRGLLCESCNRGLGFFFDDLNLLQKAVNYLKSFATEPPSVGSIIRPSAVKSCRKVQ